MEKDGRTDRPTNPWALSALILVAVIVGVPLLTIFKYGPWQWQVVTAVLIAVAAGAYMLARRHFDHR